MSVTAAQGISAGAVACGMKPEGKLDLALVHADAPVPAAAVFTRNRAAAPPVLMSRRHVADGRAQAVVLSSGCANAGTGAAGMEAARQTSGLVADLIGCSPTDVIVCSTGPIGETLPVDRIADGLGRITTDPAGGPLAAEAIMTTDTRPKQAIFRGDGFVVGGMAKGAGMVRPDMATMLAVITTDALVEATTLDRILARAVAVSFNALDIDGCESTNDTVVLMASGAGGVTPGEEDLADGVIQVCRDLSLQMAADAEGASRVVTIDLAGTADDEQALTLARAVADSALVRASFYGEDPNWGRILAALGSAPVPVDPARTAIDYAATAVARDGVAVVADHDAISEKLSGDFTVSITVGDGPGRCSLLTTDLTPDYVRFNGERS